MKKILVIEDDSHIGNMLEELLTGAGYLVSRAYSGTEAVLVLSTEKPDLALLDLMLPGLSGRDLLPSLSDIPVIVVSAKTDPAGKADLLLQGAADYVTKPFDNGELLARIAVQLRNARAGGTAHTLDFEDITRRTDTHAVSVGGAAVKLTRTEYAILKLLMQNPSQVVTKTILLEKISQDTPDCVESSLRVHISNLRKKLRSAGKRDYIEAVWGIGFKMAENETP